MTSLEIINVVLFTTLFFLLQLHFSNLDHVVKFDFPKFVKEGISYCKDYKEEKIRWLFMEF